MSDSVLGEPAEGKVALPEEYAEAHPKRLRFAVFTIMGKLVSHAGGSLLRIATEVLTCLLAPGRKTMQVTAWDSG